MNTVHEIRVVGVSSQWLTMSTPPLLEHGGALAIIHSTRVGVDAGQMQGHVQGARSMLCMSQDVPCSDSRGAQ